jgi:predicted RNase H-like HicB family nuclease
VSQPLRYSIVIEWSYEDQVFVVSLPEWGDLIHTDGDTYEAALQNGKDLLAELVAARQHAAEPLPEPRAFAGSTAAVA